MAVATSSVPHVHAQVDAVFANLSVLEGGSPVGQRNRWCLGDGTGGFSSCIDVSPDTNVSTDVALGLLDANASLDAVFANAGLAAAGQRNRVCLGGIGCSDVSSDMNTSSEVAVGMLAGDTNLDAVFANIGPVNRVCLGNGMGGFSCSDVTSDMNMSASVGLAPLSADAHLDAVFGNTGQVNRVCLGNATGGFSGCSDVSADTSFTDAVALGSIPAGLPVELQWFVVE